MGRMKDRIQRLKEELKDGVVLTPNLVDQIIRQLEKLEKVREYCKCNIKSIQRLGKEMNKRGKPLLEKKHLLDQETYLDILTIIEGKKDE